MNEDAFLVERARRGDKAAWRELWRRHAGAVRRVARGFAHLSRADVEDVVQETFMRAHRHIEGLREPERFRPWLLTVARSRALDGVRRAQAEHRAAGEFAQDPAMGPAPGEDAERLSRERRIAIVREVIDGLPEGPEKVTVQLFYVEGRLSASEIAEQLGVGKSAVTMRLERFRAKVKRRLAAALAREGQGPREAVG